MSAFQESPELLENLLLSQISDGDYLGARKTADTLELLYSEENIIENKDSFFSLSLLLFLVEGDIYGADMLLRRVNIPLDSDLFVLSLIYDHFENNDIGSALSILCAREWCDNISGIVSILVQRTREKRLQLTAKVYKSIALKELAKQLCMDESECAKTCEGLGWELDFQKGLVLPAAPTTELLQPKVSEMQLLQACTHFAGVLEKSPLRVDLTEPLAGVDDDMEGA